MSDIQHAGILLSQVFQVAEGSSHNESGLFPLCWPGQDYWGGMPSGYVSTLFRTSLHQGVLHRVTLEASGSRSIHGVAPVLNLLLSGSFTSWEWGDRQQRGYTDWFAWMLCNAGERKALFLSPLGILGMSTWAVCWFSGTGPCKSNALGINFPKSLLIWQANNIHCVQWSYFSFTFMLTKLYVEQDFKCCSIAVKV